MGTKVIRLWAGKNNGFLQGLRDTGPKRSQPEDIDIFLASQLRSGFLPYKLARSLCLGAIIWRAIHSLARNRAVKIGYLAFC